MKGAWIVSEKYIINNRDYWKCSACGQLQKLSLFENGMKFCSSCGDYKQVVHNADRDKSNIKPSKYWNISNDK